MNKKIVNALISICPNWSFTKNILTELRIKKIRSHMISEDDARRGENDSDYKKMLVNNYLRSRNSEIKQTLLLRDHVLSNAQIYQSRQNDENLKTDMIFKFIAYGFQPDEYLCFGLEHQNPEERKEWISDLDRYIFIHTMNDIKDAEIFNNKARTYRAYKEYFHRDAIEIRTESNFNSFCDFVKAHPVFVKKKIDEGVGRSVECIDSRSKPVDVVFKSIIKNGSHIIEELITQDEKMSLLNESSVNTIRCITMKTKDGIMIPYTFLKVGRKGSFIDNGGAGGILAGIDVNTGIVNTHGYDELNNEYEKHPDSAVILKGYEFPYWEQMKETCRVMAEKSPSVKCIGWDMALSNGRWVVVEGNGMTQFIGPQIVWHRGIKQEVVEIMKKM